MNDSANPLSTFGKRRGCRQFCWFVVLAGVTAFAGCASPNATQTSLTVQTSTPTPENSVGWPAGMTVEPRPATLAAVRRLPPRIGGWVRAREATGDGLVGLSVRYELVGTGAWATVYVNDQGNTPIADGLDSGPVLQAREMMLGVARGNAGGNPIEELIARVPDAPPQRFVIARAIGDGRGTASYGCATGVGGQVLRVRVTGSFPPGNTREIFALDGLVAGLLQGVTRAVASLPPPPAMTPMPEGRGFILNLPQFDRSTAPVRL